MGQGQDGCAGASDLAARDKLLDARCENRGESRCERGPKGVGDEGNVWELTEHRATSSNVSAGEVKVLLEAILLVAHILRP